MPEEHLVWTVLGAVGELDLSMFYADYRQDGHGRPAYEPSMMVALLLYAYARRNRSARGIERACVEDVAYRVIAAGYWHQRLMQNVVNDGIQVLVPPDGGLRKGTRPGWDGGLYSFMRRVLATPLGRSLYRQRQITVEPVFGQIKFNRNSRTQSRWH